MEAKQRGRNSEEQRLCGMSLGEIHGNRILPDTCTSDQKPEPEARLNKKQTAARAKERKNGGTAVMQDNRAAANFFSNNLSVLGFGSKSDATFQVVKVGTC